MAGAADPQGGDGRLGRAGWPLGLLHLCVGFIAGLVVVALLPSPSAGQTGEAPAGNLPFYYDLYTFRGESGGTDVVAAFAVPAGELEWESTGDGVRYRFDVTLVLADTVRRTVTRTDDSVFVSLARPLRGKHLLYTQIEVGARPSRHTVRRVLMSEATVPGVGQLYHAPFSIPDYRGDSLMISDIALGQPAVTAHGWHRGDVSLALLPTTQFPASSFDVYYEVYNLPEGHGYTTEIRVERIAAAGGAADAAWEDPVALRFSGTADPGRDGTLEELRRVDAAMDHGHYRLTVVITDEGTGASARRSREFHVRGWHGGATLVAAHPWRRDGQR